ncbi:MAG TPA: hypothetical protein VGP48_01860 [Stellaceae bacterium]|nr:hypothetical protein [Stellaceae bacterium]
MITKLLLSAGIVAALLAAGEGSSAAPSSTPPNCSAIAFRPMLARTNDGEQDAGLYKSRFGRIEVKASVKEGAPENYFVEINGKPLQSTGELPSAIALCAKAKRLPAPGAPDPACTGDQLQVLNVHSGDDRYVLLYAHRGSNWHFCSAGTA